MAFKTEVILSCEGRIALPAELLRRWSLKAGDRLELSLLDDDRVVMTRKARRSILTSRNELVPLSLGRPRRQSDIDHAVARAMAAQELRVRGRRQA